MASTGPVQQCRTNTQGSQMLVNAATTVTQNAPQSMSAPIPVQQSRTNTHGNTVSITSATQIIPQRMVSAVPVHES